MPARKRSTDKNFCVLVIDDDPDSRRIYSVYLRMKGWVVFSAPNGRSGIDRAEELTPDLIVLDLAMPHVDGWTVLRRLRDSSWTERIPIIVLTANVHARDEAFHAGCDAYLTKPCPPEVLFLQIRALMRFRPDVRAGAQPSRTI
jgi:two-component system, cell cycle response regulator DivK